MRSRVSIYVGRRLAFLVPQLFVVSVLAFALVKLLPGDPAVLVLGPGATPQAVEGMRESLGLDRSIVEQYGRYVGKVVQGDWGSSWFTRQSVLKDLSTRLPSTMELVVLSLVAAVGIGVVVGMVAAMNPTGAINRVLTAYGFLAGAIPDFWMGLILIFIFYYLFHLLPAPLGQISPAIAPPLERTHLLPVDSLLAADWVAFKASLMHLILPVTTLTIVYVAPILKITNATVSNVKNAPFVMAARAHGVKQSHINWYILRNSLPPIITTTGVLFVFLLGGSVLVETVFAWNGFGQYAVESVVRRDFFPIQGFMLMAATFTMLVYLIVDVLYGLVDPRVSY